MASVPSCSSNIRDHRKNSSTTYGPVALPPPGIADSVPAGLSDSAAVLLFTVFMTCVVKAMTQLPHRPPEPYSRLSVVKELHAGLLQRGDDAGQCVCPGAHGAVEAFHAPNGAEGDPRFL